MISKIVIDKAYIGVKETPYFSETNNLKTIIGIFRCLEDNFNYAKINQITHNVVEGKAFIHLFNGECGEIDCSSAPEYELQESVVNWVKEQLEMFEQKYGVKLFKELPKSQVQGKLM